MRIISSIFILGVTLVSAAVSAEDVAPGKPLEFEVTVLHLRSLDGLPANQQSLTGAAILDSLAGWRAAGKVERLTIMRMSAIENQRASVQIGESSAVVVGRSFVGPQRGGGGAQVGQSVMQMEQYGTMVVCTGRVVGGDAIEVQVSAEQTRPSRSTNLTASPGRAAEKAGGVNDPGAATDVSPPSRTVSQAMTAVTAKSGECKVIGASWNESADGTSATIVLLVPRIVSAPAK